MPSSVQRLLYAGRQLSDSDAVAGVHGIVPCATLQLSYSLRGGGGDGGSTGAESRSCYLEMYAEKKVHKVDPAEELFARWTRCHLSGELLAAPVVIDELGTLFNKDAVVHALLHKSIPSPLAYISSLKHLVDLKLEANQQGSSKKVASVNGSAAPTNESQFCCPITGVALNGRYKFVAFRSTGHVVRPERIRMESLFCMAGNA